MFSHPAESTRWLEVDLATQTLLFAILHTGQDAGLLQLFTDDLRPSTIGQPLESALSTNLRQEVQVNEADVISENCVLGQAEN